MRFKTIIIFFVICVMLVSFNYNDSETIYNSVECNDKKIALTFDDGPHPKLTPKILDILNKYDVKATFFVIGKNLDNYPTPVLRAVVEGHEIGIHTDSHSLLKSMDSEKIQSEIFNCQEKIYNLTNYSSKILRPPCGLYDKTLIDISKNNSFKIILWNIDTHDWEHMQTKAIEKTVLDNIKGGDIILFHDYISGENHNLEALEKIIPTLKNQGYEFVTVTELLQLSK